MQPNQSKDFFQLGLKELQLDVPESIQASMLSFLDVLKKWNKTHRLTGIQELEKMITHHLLDSVSIAPFCEGERFLDMGSGAGLPGIPLALLFPEKSWVLLDSSQKKTAFLLQAKAYLSLSNVAVVCTRVEQYRDSTGFDTIISRAFGTMEDIIQKTRKLLCANGRWLMMKGRYPHDELKGLDLPYTVHHLGVPYLNAERHLVIVNNVSSA